MRQHTYAKPIQELIELIPYHSITLARYLSVSVDRGLQCQFVLALSMNETAQPVLEEHINLSRLDQLCYFSYAEGLMRHGLACTVCARSVIRRRSFTGLSRRGSRTEFEPADCLAFRTAHTGNLAPFGYCRHDVSTFLLTLCAQLIRSLAHREYLFFHGVLPLAIVCSAKPLVSRSRSKSRLSRLAAGRTAALPTI